MNRSAPSTIRHPDRVRTAPWLSWTLVVATALSLGIAGQTAAQGQVSAAVGFLAGVGVALLAMLGLRSLSIRLVARVLLLVSSAVLVRFGVLGGSLAVGGQFLLAWLVVAVTIFVVADRIGTDAVPPLASGSGGTDASSGWAGSAGSIARTVTAVALGVVVFAALVAPRVLPFVARATEPGEGASLDALQDGGNALRASSSLDMTQRPDLTDEVVFTVETDRATFWRGQTFDVWDGRRWTRTDERFLPLAGVDRLRIVDHDLGARGDDTVEQRFRMETEYADIVYAAPSAVEIEIDRPVRQRPDATLVSVPLGRGAAYSVTSRREPLSADRLRAVDDGPTPDVVLEQYASPPTTTARVVEAALEVAGAEPTRYDQILALQEWMGARVEYSLESPLAPEGVDVVDHFLFEAEQGWCEQVASSLVVLARANGIPARLVTGFVPADRDAVTGRYTVRERDAHAWTEVWFPEVGWVPFDPTADVSLAGADAADPTIGQWLVDRALTILLVAVVVALAAGPVRTRVRRWLDVRRAQPTSWAGTTDRRLVALGARAGRPRGPNETAESHAAVVGEVFGSPELTDVGRLVDDALYAASPPDAAAVAWADAVLGGLERSEVPARDATPVGSAGP